MSHFFLSACLWVPLFPVHFQLCWLAGSEIIIIATESKARSSYRLLTILLLLLLFNINKDFKAEG